MSDDPGLLGNLPRSRPGTRSDKRARAPPPTGCRGRRSQARARAKAKPRPTPKVSNPKPRPAPESQPGDPMSEALKAAARIAGAGARTANDVTREILRRLPRP